MHFKTKNSQKNKFSKPQSAFTIVELLVVIVIIGILATIVIIFYIGTHDKAIDGALQSDLKGASTVLELDK
ncbi:prepilin-type cleavage/methylation domain-containing protein, partial [Candidatus Saccharibacteria bacterium HGW-Saccharibacteria-1]